MKTGIALLAIFGLTGAARGNDAAHVDNAALADRLVKQAANIHAGELVLVSGSARDLELLEDILTSLRKVGANGIISLSSDRLTRMRYDEVPARFDANASAFDVKLSEFINASIVVAINEDPEVEAKVPPERLAAVSKSSEPVTALFRKRNIRIVELGNGLYPSAKQAAAVGVSLADMTKLFWDGVAVDPAKLQATGEAVKKRLATGKLVEISSANGTKLKLRVEARPVSVSDGVISDEDIKAGGAAVQAWLPAGEVFVAPVAGSAEGRVVIDHQMFMGKEIHGLQLTFKAGKLVSMTAKDGLAPLDALYKASGVGKDAFAFVDLGINPGVQLPAQGKLQSFIPAGMVTVGIGNNVWAGGENNVDFSVISFLPGCTLKVDGQTLVDKGTLKP